MLSDSDASTHSTELVSYMNLDHYIIERSCPVWTLYYYLYCSLLFWFAGQVDLGSNSPQFSSLNLASCVALICIALFSEPDSSCPYTSSGESELRERKVEDRKLEYLKT